MPKIYGCGRGRIHREEQPPYDPENPKPLKSRKVGKAPSKPAAVVITDLQTGEAAKYPSATAAARAIGVNKNAVIHRLSGHATNPVIEGRWVVAKAKEGS